MPTTKKVIIEEQGLRDGIQNLSVSFPTEYKVDLIHRLVDAGITRIQVASFVHPKLVPQMADAEEVCRAIQKKSHVTYSGLVLNSRGVTRAIEAELDHLACSISASDTHSQRNTRKTLAEARATFKEMVASCQRAGIKVRGGIQCAFGCRYEGIISQQHVLDMVKHHLDQGIDELALADSTGMANPVQVENLMAEVIQEARLVPVILHLHNTENKGYANLFAALQAGVRIFDTAVGGLGGCPFIKSATGNIATEDTVHMLRQMGYDTEIDVNVLADISAELAKFLGHDLPAHMYDLLRNPEISII